MKYIFLVNRLSLKKKTDKMKIICDKEVTCNMDGDMLTAKEFDLKVIPKGIKIYYDNDLIEKIKMGK